MSLSSMVPHEPFFCAFTLSICFTMSLVPYVTPYRCPTKVHILTLIPPLLLFSSYSSHSIIYTALVTLFLTLSPNRTSVPSSAQSLEWVLFSLAYLLVSPHLCRFDKNYYYVIKSRNKPEILPNASF